jgi:hypothetical protein
VFHKRQLSHNAGSAFHLERFLRLAEATMIDPRKETAMSRISTPATIDAAPAASRPLLEAVKKQLGVVPNMFRLAGGDARAHRVGGRRGHTPSVTNPRAVVDIIRDRLTAARTFSL